MPKPMRIDALVDLSAPDARDNDIYEDDDGGIDVGAKTRQGINPLDAQGS